MNRKSVSQGALSLRVVLRTLLEFGAEASLEPGDPTKSPEASSRVHV